MNSSKNRSIKNSQLIQTVLLIIVVLMASLMAAAGPGVYFASELKKYVSIAIMFLAMFIFAIWKGVYKSYAFISMLALNINFAIVFMFYPQNSNVINDLHKLMIPDLFMVLATCCFFILPHKKSGSDQIKSFSPIRYYLVFIWYFFMLCIISKEYVYSMAEVLNISRALVVYFIFIFVFKSDSEAHKYLFYGIAVLVIIQGIVALLQQFGIDVFLRFTDAEFSYQTGSFNRVGGTIGRVRLHSLLTLTLPVLLVQAIYIKSKKSKLLMTLAVILGVIALALTRNRGPVIATIIAFGYVCYKLYYIRAVKFNFRFILYGSIVLIILAYFFSMGGKDVQEILKRPTYLGRIQQDKSIIKSIYMGKAHNFFFGFGPRQFIFDQYGLKNPVRSLKTPKNIYNVHNQYLLLLYESGIIGLVLYLAWLFSFFKKTTVQKRSALSNISYGEIYKTGIGGALLSLVLVSMTKPIQDNISLTILGVYMALLATVQKSFQTFDR